MEDRSCNSERKLTSIESKIDLLRVDFNKFQLKASVDIAMLKVKSGIWGILGGAIPAGIALLYTLLKK